VANKTDNIEDSNQWSLAQLGLTAARPELKPTLQPASRINLERFQELEQNIRNNPATPGPYLELGQIYIGQERWADAKRVLEVGVQACPDHEPLLVLREDLVLHQADQFFEHAKTQVAQERSDENKYALEQAEINLANERIRVCRDRYARHPNQKDLLILWAIALRQLNRSEEALALLQRAAPTPELRARANLQLGMCYRKLNRPLDALSAFRKAALFREPPPENHVKRRALMLALTIAEELSLTDSARYYGEHLLDVCEPTERRSIEDRLHAIEQTEIHAVTSSLSPTPPT
jgi:uncharacterized protein HemY